MATLTPEKVAEILRLYEETGFVSETAARAGVTDGTARRYLRRAGIDTSNPTREVAWKADINEEEFVEMYQTGTGITDLMEHFKCSHATAKKLINKHQLHLPTQSGRVAYREPETLELPEPGEIKRYILTSAQNNTPVHEPLWNNILLAADYLNAELMVSRYTYNKAAYRSAASVKVGKEPTREDLARVWYDDRLAPYFCDGADKPERYRLAPGLIWCSEQNILPTNQHPLASLEGYTRRESGIFPHATLAMRSVASMKDEAAKFNFTTGTVTQRNYIQKLTGMKAEFWHSYSALLVEVDSLGNWWVRQLEADEDGVFYNLDQKFDGKVSVGHRPTAINWGDVHADEVEQDVLDLCEEILDELQPENQFLHDLLSFRRQGHHERDVASKRLEKMYAGENEVEGEIDETAGVANTLFRDFCQAYVVSSNHDRHGERWMDELDWKKDLPNAKHFFEAWLSRITAMEAGLPWTYAEWSLRRAGINEQVIFLDQNKSFELAGIEFSLHGDQGPNGARGSTRNLTKLGRKINKGHDHQATIDHDVWSAGACHLDFDYMTGPGSHSISHILTYENGTRTMITCWNGDYRAR